MNTSMDIHFPDFTENGSPTDQGCLRNPCNIVSSAYHYVLVRFRGTHVNKRVNERMLDSKAIHEDRFLTLKRETWETPEGRKIRIRKCYKNRVAKKYLKNEKAILRAAQGPNIVPLIETEDKNILMPYAGETLLCILSRDRSRGLPLPKFENYARQLMQGVAHMHQSGIWHLDLKLGNLLADESDEDKLSIIDFGLSQRGGPAKQKEFCSEGYKPPEMFHRGYKTISVKTDIFSAGVVLFELLTNYILFPHPINIRNKQYMANQASYYEYLDDRLKEVEAIDKGCAEDKHYAKLIRSMLAWNPEDRPDANVVLDCFMRS
ncbi:protein kinase [Endozoicomonas sp. ONNA2]|uniref:protein kinase domain-containing protein n=1 Tax=Endozoicomonas sp. ONNA2 TaxID=2828741 RepID=UPI002148F5D4|nr:protein kinase [Endozoicomonas sp. ONNA2]